MNSDQKPKTKSAWSTYW